MTPLLVALRSLWWRRVRRYVHEICTGCGRPVAQHSFGLERVGGELSPVTYWFADNPLWNAVVGGYVGVLCPRCFTTEAERQGVAVGWRCGRVGEIER